MIRTLMLAMSALNVWVYRASAGKLMGRFPGGAPVLLLTTKGRKTGKARTAPLLYLEDSGRYVIVASQGGAPKHPAWFFNLEAEPRATIEIGARKFEASYRKASAEERARLWPKLVAIYAPYADYQKRTSREIPLALLSPA